MSETDSRKRRKFFFEPEMPEAWHGRCLQWDGRAIQSLADHKHQKLGMARACSGTAVHDPHPTKTLFFPSSSIILQQPHLSNFSLKPPQPPTFKPSYLPQIYTKSQNFFTQTIPYITLNIIHQSKTTFIHPHQNSPKILFPINLT